MPLIAADLANSIKTALGETTVSSQLLALSTAIVDELKAASFSHTPFNLFGAAPPSGGPIIAAGGTAGAISGITGASLANRVQSNDPSKFPTITTELSGMCNGIAAHLSSGLIDFAAGTITGSCFNTISSPGPFTGVASNGTILGLDGTTMANLVTSSVPYPSTSAKLLAKCNAIVSYVQSNISLSYSLVTGTCSAGGGPVVFNPAIGGTIV